jgi:hypothetical protein
MNFMAKEQSQLICVLADFGSLLYKSFLAFFEQIEITALPETPGITCRKLPTECDAPEHRQDFDLKFRA